MLQLWTFSNLQQDNCLSSSSMQTIHFCFSCETFRLERSSFKEELSIQIQNKNTKNILNTVVVNFFQICNRQLPIVHFYFSCETFRLELFSFKEELSIQIQNKDTKIL